MAKTFHHLLSHGGGEGALIREGALIFNFGRWEGRLFEAGTYSRGGGGANSKI